MDVNSVKTLGDFFDFIRAMLEDGEIHFKGSLEEYLRALWGILSAKKDAAPRWSLFASSFKAAYSSPIPDFEEGWMAYEKQPILDNETPKDDFALVEQMLLYQIADLRRMKDAGIFDGDGRMIWMGVISPTKHSWQNLSDYNFLEGASRWMEDARLDFSKSDCNWFDLALFLELGQIYE